MIDNATAVAHSCSIMQQLLIQPEGLWGEEGHNEGQYRIYHADEKNCATHILGQIKD